MSFWRFIGEIALFKTVCNLLFGHDKPTRETTFVDEHPRGNDHTLDDCDFVSPRHNFTHRGSIPDSYSHHDCLDDDLDDDAIFGDDW